MVTEHDFQVSILNLAFVPFLGAGASAPISLPLDVSQDPWTPLAGRLANLFQTLEADPSDHAFLQSFVTSYDIEIHLPTKHDGALLSRPREPLYDFQLALIGIASHLTDEIGFQLRELRPAIRSVESFGVPNTHKRDSELFTALDQAIESVRSLSADDGTILPIELELLPKSEIELKLVHLGWLIFDGGEKAAEWTRKHSTSVEKIRNYKSKYLLDPGQIRLDEISWLTGLLWLSLRARIPVYPSIKDLATAVSLRWPLLGPRTTELPVAADFRLASEMQAVALIQEWFRFCEAPRRRTATGDRILVGRPGMLHEAVACALTVMYREFNKWPHSDIEPMNGYPIAFTTNYDRELENAFEWLRLSYHVLFPVVRTSSGGQFQAPPAWLIQSIRFENDYRTCKSQIVKNAGRRPEADKQMGSRGPIELWGPIVVKLHGSPLDEIPPEIAAGGHRPNQHNLVLSELDYLRNVVSEIGAGPEWLGRPLSGKVNGEKKHLWFLGYSVSDWNVRLRLYKQISQRKQGTNKDETPNKTNVNRFIDPLTEPLMSELDILPEEEDLSSFASTLASAPDVQKLMESIHQRLRL